MNILVESITQLKLCGGLFHIRVWRQEGGPFTPEESRKDLLYQINKMWLDKKFSTQEELASWILEIEGVNAVEVKDSNGNGIVVYDSWP